MTPKDAMLRQTWITAAQAPEGLNVVCGSPQEAHALRMALYKVARKVRLDPASDPEFAEAREKCSMWIKGAVLTVGPSLISPMLSGGLAEALKAHGAIMGGQGLEQAINEAAAAESLKSLEQTLKQGEAEDAARPQNPYYKRKEE